VLVKAVAAHDAVALAANHVDGVLDVDALEHLVLGVGHHLGHRAGEKLARVDGVREHVLDGPPAGLVPRVVDLAVSGPV